MSELGTQLAIAAIDGGLRLSGEIDAQTAPALQSQLDDHLAGTNDVHLDMSMVTFMDSSGLRVLLGATETCRSRGGDLELLDPTPTVARLLDISGLADHFTVSQGG